MKLYTHFLPINIARILIFVIGSYISYRNKIEIFFNIAIICIIFSIIYLLIETLFNLTEKLPITCYVATSLDIMGSLTYAYFTGMNSVFFGAILYITALCALNLKTKQAEFSLIFTLILHISMLLLINFNILPYENIFAQNSKPNFTNIYTSFFLVHVVNYFIYKIIRDLVNKNYKLLCNILPIVVVDEIEKFGKYEAKSHNDATIVFTDFVNFTDKTKNIEPTDVVKVLDSYFSEFDKIIKNRNLEKLKTIGDGYMFASGVPEKNISTSLNALQACIEIIDAVEDFKSKNIFQFDVRIGIASGPLMAAVIGKEKFSYDVWGETVNLASRIESNSSAGQIAVCENTYQHLKNNYSFFIDNDKILKGFGNIPIYFFTR